MTNPSQITYCAAHARTSDLVRDAAAARPLPLSTRSGRSPASGGELLRSRSPFGLPAQDRHERRPVSKGASSQEAAVLAVASGTGVGDGGASLIMSPDQVGSLADGLVERPDASATVRVGSFADSYVRARKRRPMPNRRLRRHRVAPAPPWSSRSP
jgi:hypothetical protein